MTNFTKPPPILTDDYIDTIIDKHTYARYRGCPEWNQTSDLWKIGWIIYVYCICLMFLSSLGFNVVLVSKFYKRALRQKTPTLFVIVSSFSSILLFLFHAIDPYGYYKRLPILLIRILLALPEMLICSLFALVYTLIMKMTRLDIGINEFVSPKLFTVLFVIYTLAIIISECLVSSGILMPEMTLTSEIVFIGFVLYTSICFIVSLPKLKRYTREATRAKKELSIHSISNNDDVTLTKQRMHFPRLQKSHSGNRITLISDSDSSASDTEQNTEQFHGGYSKAKTRRKCHIHAKKHFKESHSSSSEKETDVYTLSTYELTNKNQFVHRQISSYDRNSSPVGYKTISQHANQYNKSNAPSVEQTIENRAPSISNSSCNEQHNSSRNEQHNSSCNEQHNSSCNEQHNSSRTVSLSKGITLSVTSMELLNRYYIDPLKIHSLEFFPSTISDNSYRCVSEPLLVPTSLDLSYDLTSNNYHSLYNINLPHMLPYGINDFGITSKHIHPLHSVPPSPARSTASNVYEEILPEAINQSYDIVNLEQQIDNVENLYQSETLLTIMKDNSAPTQTQFEECKSKFDHTTHLPNIEDSSESYRQTNKEYNKSENKATVNSDPACIETYLSKENKDEPIGYVHGSEQDEQHVYDVCHMCEYDNQIRQFIATAMPPNHKPLTKTIEVTLDMNISSLTDLSLNGYAISGNIDEIISLPCTSSTDFQPIDNISTGISNKCELFKAETNNQITEYISHSDKQNSINTCDEPNSIETISEEKKNVEYKAFENASGIKEKSTEDPMLGAINGLDTNGFCRDSNAMIIEQISLDSFEEIFPGANIDEYLDFQRRYSLEETNSNNSNANSFKRVECDEKRIHADDVTLENFDSQEESALDAHRSTTSNDCSCEGFQMEEKDAHNNNVDISHLVSDALILNCDSKTTNDPKVSCVISKGNKGKLDSTENLHTIFTENNDDNDKSNADDNCVIQEGTHKHCTVEDSDMIVNDTNDIGTSKFFQENSLIYNKYVIDGVDYLNIGHNIDIQPQNSLSDVEYQLLGNNILNDNICGHTISDSHIGVDIPQEGPLVDSGYTADSERGSIHSPEMNKRTTYAVFKQTNQRKTSALSGLGLNLPTSSSFLSFQRLRQGHVLQHVTTYSYYMMGLCLLSCVNSIYVIVSVIAKVRVTSTLWLGLQITHRCFEFGALTMTTVAAHRLITSRTCKTGKRRARKVTDVTINNNTTTLPRL